MAVLAPTPTAKVRSVTAVNMGARLSLRKTWLSWGSIKTYYAVAEKRFRFTLGNQRSFKIFFTLRLPCSAAKTSNGFDSAR